MLRKLFSRNKVKQLNLKDNYYIRVDECPILFWHNCNTKKEFSSLRKGVKGDEFNDQRAYEALFNDYVENIGLSNEYQRILQKEQYLTDLKLKFILSLNEEHQRDRNMINEINLIELELEEMKKGEGVSFFQNLAKISKVEGRRIDPLHTTIIEYHSTIKNINTNE